MWKKEVYIVEIESNSPLSLLPVQQGDIIIGVSNIQVSDVKNFEEIFKREIKRNLNSILLTLVDINNQNKFIGVKIK